MLLAVAPAQAQSLAGLAALSGTVRDSTGALITDAAVTVSNPNLGIDRKITTNSDGYFIASSLPPASGYEVTVTKTGFTGFSAKNVQLMVGQNITIPVQLNVAQQAESVTVSAEVPLIEETKSGVSTAVENTQIHNLPINGRRVDQFALLTPGAVTDGSSGEISFRGIPGGNAFLQDGNDVTQQWGIDIAGGVDGSLQHQPGRRAGISGANLRLQRRVRARRGRRHQYRHQERHESISWHRLLVLPQSHAGRDRSLRSPKSAGVSSSGGRQFRRADFQGQAVLLR